MAEVTGKTVNDTPIRSLNGVWIQIAGSKLNLFSFESRHSQNNDGTGYNVFNGLKFIVSGGLNTITKHMENSNIKIEKDCCIVNLPKHLYK